MSTDINNILFEINGYNFIMNRNNDYYIISIDGTKLDWIDTINIYSINKRPTKEKLLDKIKKKLNSDDINFKSTNIKKEETIEAKIFRELERLKRLSYQNNNNVNIKIVKQIFNDNTEIFSKLVLIFLQFSHSILLIAKPIN